MPLTSRSVLAESVSKKPGMVMSSRVFRPAVIATGFPESVPAW